MRLQTNDIAFASEQKHVCTCVCTCVCAPVSVPVGQFASASTPTNCHEISVAGLLAWERNPVERARRLIQAGPWPLMDSCAAGERTCLDGPDTAHATRR